MYGGYVHPRDVVDFESRWLRFEFTPEELQAAQDRQSQWQANALASAQADALAQASNAEQNSTSTVTSSATSSNASATQTIDPSGSTAVATTAKPVGVETAASSPLVPVVSPNTAPPAPDLRDARLDAALKTRLATPLVVRVQILVDRDLAERMPNWLDYSQQLTQAANNSLGPQLGMRLDLVGISRLHGNLATDDFDAIVGAKTLIDPDLQIALSAKSWHVGEAPAFGKWPALPGQSNAASMVLPSTAGAHLPHLWPLLFGVGRAMGAAAPLVQTEPSWMSPQFIAPTAGEAAVWPLDFASRSAILSRKDLSFEHLGPDTGGKGQQAP